MSEERVLIAVLNDERVFQTVLQEFLWQEGFDVSVFMLDGNALHDLVSRPPALILLDINPAMEERGLGLLHNLQEDPLLARIPVLLMSVDTRLLAAHEDELRARGDDTLAEPFNLDDLKIKVDRLLMQGYHDTAHEQRISW